MPYVEKEKYYRLVGVDEILITIDDNLLSLQTMSNNKFVMNIKDQVNFWENKIQLVREIMDEWLTFQRYWLSLETIFSASDI